MLVIASPLAKTIKLCLKKLKIILGFSVINVVKKHFVLFLKISFYIGRIRIRNDNTGSGSGSEENIPDPDPQPCKNLLIY